MNVRKLIEGLRGELKWREFYKLTGISLSQLWKIEHQGHSCPPEKVKILYGLAQEHGKPFSQKEIITLLLGGELAGRLADRDLLLAGSMTLEEWLKHDGSRMSQTKILGLHYSTAYHRQEGKFRRFWPKRAVEIARRSNYQIDLFELLGADRKWLGELTNG